VYIPDSKMQFAGRLAANSIRFPWQIQQSVSAGLGHSSGSVDKIY